MLVVRNTAFRAIVVLIIVMISLVPPVEGKRKKKSYKAIPLKITSISTSPIPYVPGHGSLTITVDVVLPEQLNGADLLEVSSLISFPSKRSIRFLFKRHSLQAMRKNRKEMSVRTTLSWDGTDQTNQLVEKGAYNYEIQAKLMVNRHDFPRTAMVSLKKRGALVVSSPLRTQSD